MGLSPVFVLFILLVAALSADAKNYRRERTWYDPNVVTEWLKEVETAVRVHADPLQRAIACRVPYGNVSVESVALATEHTKHQIIYAATNLRDRGLVKFIFNGPYPTIVPANERSRELMRKWAEQWCVSDDKCDVSK